MSRPTLSREELASLRRAYEAAATQPPPVPDRISHRAAFTTELAEVLRRMVAEGWTAEQLASVAAQAGVQVAPSTMRAYIAATAERRTPRASRRAAQRRRSASAADGPSAAAGAAPVAEGAANATADAAKTPEGCAPKSDGGAPPAKISLPPATGGMNFPWNRSPEPAEDHGQPVTPEDRGS